MTSGGGLSRQINRIRRYDTRAATLGQHWSDTTPEPYGPRSRGISSSDVYRAADALLREGERPTIEKIRSKLGTGSPNTINPLLDAWWKTLSARLDSGPAALHRLPESVAFVAEALWMQALGEGRRRAAQELSSAARVAVMDKQQLEVRSHVLSLREGELESRLRDREHQQAALESQLQALTTLLRKEQATREAYARRIAQLETELLARPCAPTTKAVARTPPTHKGKKQPRSAGTNVAVRPSLDAGEAGRRWSGASRDGTRRKAPSKTPLARPRAQRGVRRKAPNKRRR